MSTAPSLETRSGLNQWLLTQSLNRLHGFKYLVGAAATVVLTGSTLLLFKDLQAAVIGITLLLLFGFILVVLEVAHRKANARATAHVAVFVLWSAAILFVLLAGGAVVYVVKNLFISRQSQFTAAEIEVNQLRSQYDSVRGDWEAAVAHRDDPTWPMIATRARAVAADLSAIRDNQLSASFEIYKYRFLGASRMIACHAWTKLQRHEAAELCSGAIQATLEAIRRMELAEQGRQTDKDLRAAADWARSEQQMDRAYRELAVQHAIIFARTSDQQSANGSCAALSHISPDYAALDPPNTSTILQPVLPLCAQNVAALDRAIRLSECPSDTLGCRAR
jgi:hypothetical protein